MAVAGDLGTDMGVEATVTGVSIEEEEAVEAEAGAVASSDGDVVSAGAAVLPLAA